MKKALLFCFISITFSLFSEVNPLEVLTVLRAKQSFIETKGSDTFLLLAEVNDTVLMFTDKPVPKAWEMDTLDYVERWNTLYHDVAPNVALVQFVKDSIDMHTSVIQIKDPKYLPNTKALQFSVIYGKKEKKLPEGDLGEVALLIDAY